MVLYFRRAKANFYLVRTGILLIEGKKLTCVVHIVHQERNTEAVIYNQT